VSGDPGAAERRLDQVDALLADLLANPNSGAFLSAKLGKPVWCRCDGRDDRRYVHDRQRLLFIQRGPDGSPGYKKCSDHVDVQRSPEILRAAVGDRTVRYNPRAVDQNVHRPVTGKMRRNRGLVRDVDRMGRDPIPAQEWARCVGEIDVEQPDVGASRVKGLGVGGADALRAACAKGVEPSSSVMRYVRRFGSCSSVLRRLCPQASLRHVG